MSTPVREHWWKMGEEGRQQWAKSSALLCGLSTEENGGTFLQEFSSARVTSCPGGFFLPLVGNQGYN